MRWRIVDLMQWLWEELRLSVSKQTMSKELRAMGFRKLSARPRHHAKDDAAEAAFKLATAGCSMPATKSWAITQTIPPSFMLAAPG